MDKKVRILIMHPELVVGGVEKALLEMLRVLDKEKFEITLLLRNRACWDNRIPSYIDVRYMMSRRFCQGAIGARLYKYISIFFPYIIYSLRGSRRKFDIAIAYHEPMIWFLPCVKSYRISWVHSDYSVRQFPPEVKNMANKTGIVANMIKIRRKRLIQSLNKIVFVAKTCIDSYVEKNRVNISNTTVCYNICNEREIIELSLEPITDQCWNDYKGIHLVVVGRIHQEKGMHRLIPLMQHLKEAEIDAKIYIVGDGSERRAMEILIAEANLTDRFELLGFQQNPYKYIVRSKLLLCCSPSEAYCTVTKESILLGIPFITTRCSGMEEQIGKTKAALIVPNEDDALAPYVIKVLLDEKLYSKMKHDAILRRVELSDNKNAMDIERMLIACLGD
jgi:glycosyltransferase involved in cell wall biosynthesis